MRTHFPRDLFKMTKLGFRFLTEWSRTRLFIAGLVPACQSGAYTQLQGALLVAEMPVPGQHHGQTRLIGCADDFIIPHGAAGLDYSGGACLCGGQ